MDSKLQKDNIETTAHIPDASEFASWQKRLNQSEKTDTDVDPDNPEHVIVNGKYEILHKLGQGSQGHVFLAKVKETGELVAIKRLRIDSVKTWKEYELFARESAVLASLNMEGVAHFYESIECLETDMPCAYIVQEYIDGQTLTDMLSNGQRIAKKRVFNIAMQLVALLEILHTHNPPIIHRDLKPGNVMIRKGVDGSDQVFLIDFGAVANPQIQSGGSTVAGTFGYMPPEQLVGTPFPASDIYALGAMISYMLSGVAPSEMQISNDFRLIIEPHLEGENPAVLSLLRQMLDPNASTRLIDYGLMERAFSLFSEEQYDIDVSAGCMDYHSEAYNKQLNQVGSLWQPGNFSLWQTLPEIAPRALPTTFNNFKFATLASTTPITRRQDFFVGFIKKLFPLFIVFLAISLFISVHDLNDMFKISDALGISISFVFSCLCYILFCFFLSINSYNSNKTTVFSNSKITSTPTLSDDSAIQKLITQGNKAIANITKINYVKRDIDEHQHETYILKDKAMTYIHDMPEFVIEYSFTSPAARHKNCTLKGRVITHRCPVGKIMPGDTLPILYDLDNCMPFPFPLGDVTQASDLVSKIESD